MTQVTGLNRDDDLPDDGDPAQQDQGAQPDPAAAFLTMPKCDVGI